MEPLIALDAAKTWLGLPAEAGPADAVAQLALDAAEAVIAGLLGRERLAAPQEAVTERVSGTGASVIQLQSFPVLEVAAVHCDGRATVLELSEMRSWNDLITATSTPKLEDIDADRTGGLWRRDGATWPRGSRNITVTYRGGWTPQTLPADLKLLVLQTAALCFRARGKEGLKSESVGDYAASFATPTQEDALAIPGAAATIAKYRRIAA